ncbi:unnamed protein product, partial [Gulo gulo]
GQSLARSVRGRGGGCTGLVGSCQCLPRLGPKPCPTPSTAYRVQSLQAQWSPGQRPPGAPSHPPRGTHTRPSQLGTPGVVSAVSRLYLVSRGETAPTLMPRDLGVGLPGHHAVQVQGLPFGHVGGGGLDADGLGAARSWG